jgi:formamidopyrimidine-DNA glycosylase
MPELPEVETTRRGIAAHIEKQTITNVVVRNSQLRWPVPRGLGRKLAGHKIRKVSRRGKYLLIDTSNGTLMLHLGMSGSLRVLAAETKPQKHDHVDIVLGNGLCLRLRDPRRFGSIHYIKGDPFEHALLNKLGPEPLSDEFNAELLFRLSRKRSVAVKNFIMNSHIVVGVGNIYASESLFLAGIDPRRKAGSISKSRYERLAAAIKQVIRAAIDAGGTTLRDFTSSDGKPGYFAQELKVYGLQGHSCPGCGKAIQQLSIGQRTSYFCPRCQT